MYGMISSLSNGNSLFTCKSVSILLFALFKLILMRYVLGSELRRPYLYVPDISESKYFET